MKRKINIIIFSLIFSISMAIIILIIAGIRLKPVLFEIAKAEALKIESTIINKTINELINEGYDTNNLFYTIKADDGMIETIDFNSTQVNKLLSIITMKIQENLSVLEKGMIEDLGINSKNIDQKKKINLNKGIIIEIPFGIISSNIILADLGSKIPIKIHYLNDIKSNINTKIKEYGINNAMIEIYINIEISAKVLLPFISERILLTTSVPIAIKMIQGKIPTYYGNGITKESNIYSIPIE